MFPVEHTIDDWKGGVVMVVADHALAVDLVNAVADLQLPRPPDRAVGGDVSDVDGSVAWHNGLVLAAADRDSLVLTYP